jgi:hypothetical protein
MPSHMTNARHVIKAAASHGVVVCVFKRIEHAPLLKGRIFDRCVIDTLERLVPTYELSQDAEAKAIRYAAEHPEAFTRWCRRHPAQVRALLRN